MQSRGPWQSQVPMIPTQGFIFSSMDAHVQVPMCHFGGSCALCPWDIGEWGVEANIPNVAVVPQSLRTAGAKIEGRLAGRGRSRKLLSGG